MDSNTYTHLRHQHAGSKSDEIAHEGKDSSVMLHLPSLSSPSHHHDEDKTRSSNTSRVPSPKFTSSKDTSKRPSLMLPSLHQLQADGSKDDSRKQNANEIQPPRRVSVLERVRGLEVSGAQALIKLMPMGMIAGNKVDRVANKNITEPQQHRGSGSSTSKHSFESSSPLQHDHDDGRAATTSASSIHPHGLAARRVSEPIPNSTSASTSRKDVREKEGRGRRGFSVLSVLRRWKSPKLSTASSPQPSTLSSKSQVAQELDAEPLPAMEARSVTESSHVAGNQEQHNKKAEVIQLPMASNMLRERIGTKTETDSSGVVVAVALSSYESSSKTSMDTSRSDTLLPGVGTLTHSSSFQPPPVQHLVRSESAPQPSLHTEASSPSPVQALSISCCTAHASLVFPSTLPPVPTYTGCTKPVVAPDKLDQIPSMIATSSTQSPNTAHAATPTTGGSGGNDQDRSPMKRHSFSTARQRRESLMRDSRSATPTHAHVSASSIAGLATPPMARAPSIQELLAEACNEAKAESSGTGSAGSAAATVSPETLTPLLRPSQPSTYPHLQVQSTSPSLSPSPSPPPPVVYGAPNASGIPVHSNQRVSFSSNIGTPAAGSTATPSPMPPALSLPPRTPNSVRHAIGWLTYPQGFPHLSPTSTSIPTGAVAGGGALTSQMLSTSPPSSGSVASGTPQPLSTSPVPSSSPHSTSPLLRKQSTGSPGTAPIGSSIPTASAPGGSSITNRPSLSVEVTPTPPQLVRGLPTQPAQMDAASGGRSASGETTSASSTSPPIGILHQSNPQKKPTTPSTSDANTSSDFTVNLVRHGSSSDKDTTAANRATTPASPPFLSTFQRSRSAPEGEIDAQTPASGSITTPALTAPLLADVTPSAPSMPLPPLPDSRTTSPNSPPLPTYPQALAHAASATARLDLTVPQLVGSSAVAHPSPPATALGYEQLPASLPRASNSAIQLGNEVGASEESEESDEGTPPPIPPFFLPTPSPLALDSGSRSVEHEPEQTALGPPPTLPHSSQPVATELTTLSPSHNHHRASPGNLELDANAGSNLTLIQPRTPPSHEHASIAMRTEPSPPYEAISSSTPPLLSSNDAPRDQATADAQSDIGPITTVAPVAGFSPDTANVGIDVNAMDSELAILRCSLQSCIDREEFESCIQLRDRIRELERHGQKCGSRQ